MKDYSKLRPFDLEAAQDRGELLTGSNPHFEGKPVWKYVAGPDALGKIIAIVLDGGHFANPASMNAFRMAPLAWVRKSANDDTLWPVYKGDVLYKKLDGCAVKVLSVHEQSYCAKDSRHNGYLDNLTWTQPKVKREGFAVIRKEKVFSTKTAAEERRHQCAIPENWVVSQVEWEE